MVFRPVNEWRVIAFASPHKITNAGYVKNIYLQPLVVDPSFEDFKTKKNFAFSLIFPSFGPSSKSGLGKSWQIVDFIFTFEDFWF